MAKYKISDTYEAMLGTFITVLFFFSLRAGESFPRFSNSFGLILTISWFFAIYNSFSLRNGEHFFINIGLVYLFSAILSIGFGMTTWEHIKATPFSGPTIIATWMALPIALLFDKHNIKSVLSRYYVRGVNKRLR